MKLNRIITVLLSFTFAAQLSALDLSHAVVVTPSGLGEVEQKAIQSLVEEIEKRTAIRLPVQQSAPSGGQPTIAVGPIAKVRDYAGALAGEVTSAEQPGPEGYVLRTGDHAVVIAGADPRGVLYGVGHLLRKLEMRSASIDLPKPLNLSTTPETGLRGHQLGYRPKTNTYDAWTVEMWDQYIRELALFGANAIELIPPRSDDDDLSPHLPIPKIDMMEHMSRIGKSYGQDIWIWYPALDEDYSRSADVEFALKEWGEIFKRVPYIDYIFVPGGDPGHTPPKPMFALLEKQTENLHKYHPDAEMWMSPQSFDGKGMEEFFELMEAQPKWLGGIVFGPQQRIGLPELRRRTPKNYPIRRYPDITHSRHCQYPVPDWDLAYAVTEAREVINPRPVDQARIYRLLESHAIGFLTYSEGNHDDVNKFIWSGLGWDQEQRVVEILRDYSRFFIGPDYADSWAQGMFSLEQNWRGPLAQNAGVYTTLTQFRSMELSASPQLKLNWRFQQGLYRAYYDAYNRSRLIYETALEEEAMSQLRRAPLTGARLALDGAQAALDRSLTDPVSQDWRARIFELAEALYQSIRAQLSVPRYQAIRVGRGANLDTVDMPLNDRIWLTRQFEKIRTLTSEQSQLDAIDALVNRTNPGPGGFYDDLGNLTRQPHLVRGVGYRDDPAHLDSSLVGFASSFAVLDEHLDMPMAWWRHAEALHEGALEMHYEHLDRAAAYRVRVVYAGDSPQVKIELKADGEPVHGLITSPIPFEPIEFDIPKAATQDGELTLRWRREPGLGGNGRGNQVAEVWLMRK
ncbi:MAG: alpha-glucuronidase family glycosyl hydrolase [Acidobacteria bacterium]|nr:alpha-glucuronidase family glycosyl hydrolase [Acidobacteriota bacterium]MDA1234200.1 alpha-glucuronidase family glycosyl hydrolase [Acidobacteriota bacterium]